MEKMPIENEETSGPELTFRQIYEEGQRLEREGDKLGAAAQYEKSYSHTLAIKMYEEGGDIAQAYKLAMKHGEKYTANRLADKHNIPGHEYSDFPPARGREFIETMIIALKSRLREGAAATHLGFIGFKDKTVLDIGTRDGRFIPLFESLGAKEVFGIDPDRQALEEAVSRGSIDKEHALPVKLQELPQEMRGKFQVAAILNLNIALSEQKEFFRELHDIMPRDGQVIMTVAEDIVLQNAISAMNKYFYARAINLWRIKQDYLHKNLVVCSKKN